MYVCMYMFMHTCTCMSCIYSMSWIHRYMYISIRKKIRSPSRHHLAHCQRRSWQYQRLKIFVWESRGNWGSWTSWSFCSFWEPQSCPPNRRHSSDPWKKKSSLLFRWKKNRDFETKRVDLSPPGGTLPEGRERDLRERDGSHKRSRNYSRELRECTPLQLTKISLSKDVFWYTFVLQSYQKTYTFVPRRGYRDSLLETAQEAVTVLYKRVHWWRQK